MPKTPESRERAPPIDATREGAAKRATQLEITEMLCKLHDH